VFDGITLGIVISLAFSRFFKQGVNQSMKPTAVRFMHAYDIRPRKDHRSVDLISDALPFGGLWYAEPNAVSSAIGYAQFPCWFGISCVLGIPPWPRLRHAQAREEEAETLRLCLRCVDHS
jgi:hypothetical protein